jgi:hypothetical protein
MQRLPDDIATRLAWRFESLLTGTFKRNKYRHHDYPKLAPVPSHRAATRPIEDTDECGPWIYFVIDGKGRVRYVGKSEERCVLQRWIRPDDHKSAPTHYWTHSTGSGGSVFNIARGLRQGEGPFELRYVSLARLDGQFARADLKKTEAHLIALLDPDWNG